MTYCKFSVDLKDVCELYKEWTGRDIKKFSLPKDVYLVIARDKSGGAIGAAQVLLIEDYVFDRRWGLVENVYVASNHRRQGVGEEIMSFIEKEFLETGICEFIKLTSRKELGKALYRSMGYAEGSSFRKGR